MLFTCFDLLGDNFKKASCDNYGELELTYETMSHFCIVSLDHLDKGGKRVTKGVK